MKVSAAEVLYSFPSTAVNYEFAVDVLQKRYEKTKLL